MENNKNKNSTTSILWAFVVGALAGFLFAPKSGKGARQWVEQQGSHLKARGRDLWEKGGVQTRYRAGSLQGWAHKIKDVFSPEPELLEADDDIIEQRVRVAIGENPRTWDLPHVNVNSENGIVTLRGPVQSLREKENLERLVKRVRGVEEVINKTKLVA